MRSKDSYQCSLAVSWKMEWAVHSFFFFFSSEGRRWMEKITVPQIKLSLLKQNNIFPHFSKAKRSKTLCSHPTQRFPQHRHTQTGQKQTQLTFLSKQPTSAPCPNSLKKFFLKTNKGKKYPSADNSGLFQTAQNSKNNLYCRRIWLRG